MPESFLRATWRRSLRVKRSKSLVIEEKRKSDSFVNSQEWTLSRDVPDLRLGIVGSLSSCKSALVHRYLTGSYMQEESPEGGRFKKEIMVDGKSYLLLIRDEGGPPEQQFTAWVDAVIFVFSVENESSFNAIYTYYSQMAHFRKSADIPFILVGTQDAICETNPRVIDESRARKLSTDLKRCTYWETCATYGLHVERVFEEACQKIVQQRNVKASCLTPTGSRPSTPNAVFSPVPCGGPARHLTAAATAQHSPTNNGFASPGAAGSESPSHNQSLTPKCVAASSPVRLSHPLSSASHPLRQQDSNRMESPGAGAGSPTASLPADNNNVSPKFPAPPPPALVASPDLMPPPQIPRDKDLPTPSSTPTTARKSRRKSNLFTQKKGDDRVRNYELGIGRDIPLKQGFLSKRSSTSLNKEFKKKYVTIMSDGTLSYHPSINDYIAEKDGKDITLQTASVKIPGQMPCTYKTATKETAKAAALAANHPPPSNGVSDDLAALSIKGYSNKDKRATDKVLLTAYDLIKEPTGGQQQQPAAGDEGPAAAGDVNSASLANGADAKLETPSVKKRHRRIKSSGVKHGDGEDSDREFVIVSMHKQWHFMASDTAERDEWVTAIEEQILRSIQAIESSKVKSGVMNCADTKAAVQYIRTEVAGNAYCADCDAPNPEWASLNLGVLMCIQCSGTHRNLGSHISRVRSLQLDDWPLSHTSVMIVLGNSLANSVWEADTGGRAKPTPDSSQEEKERWIRDKYEGKQFLAPLPSANLVNSLYEAVRRSDMKLLVQCLAHCNPEQVNHRLNKADGRAPIHFACENADLATVQLLIWNNASVTILDDREHTLVQCTSLAFIASRDRTTVPTVARDQALMTLLRSNGCLDMAAHLTPNFNKKRQQAAHRPGYYGSAM